MLAKAASRVSLGLTLFCVGALLAVAAEPAKTANLLANPSFEDGTDSWNPAAGGITDVKFTVDSAEAADGKKSALLKLGAVESYGLQFGQTRGRAGGGQDVHFRRRWPRA